MPVIIPAMDEGLGEQGFTCARGRRNESQLPLSNERSGVAELIPGHWERFSCRPVFPLALQ